MRDCFLIVDGNSLMHRAFHALPVMDAGNGVYTNAIHGFLNMLLKVVKEENVRYLAVCFDEHGPTFRHTAFADYKAGRSATPDELRQQLKTIRLMRQLKRPDELGIEYPVHQVIFIITSVYKKSRKRYIDISSLGK